MGGEVRFHTKVTGIRTKRSIDFSDEPALAMLHLEDIRTNIGEDYDGRCSTCHWSQRQNAFGLLNLSDIKMEPKPFAVGVRVEHPQDMIDESQYGKNAREPSCCCI